MGCTFPWSIPQPLPTAIGVHEVETEPVLSAVRHELDAGANRPPPGGVIVRWVVRQVVLVAAV